MRATIRAMNAILALLVVSWGMWTLSKGNESVAAFVGQIIGIGLLLMPFFLAWRAIDDGAADRQRRIAIWVNCIPLAALLLMAVVASVMGKLALISLMESAICVAFAFPFALNVYAMRKKISGASRGQPGRQQINPQPASDVKWPE